MSHAIQSQGALVILQEVAVISNQKYISPLPLLHATNVRQLPLQRTFFAVYIVF